MAAPELTLGVGEQREICLPGRGGAGYSWTVELIEPAQLVRVAHRGTVAAADPDARRGGGRPPDNASRAERFVVEGRSPGRGRVRLALRRSWERDVEPLERRELNVSVVADGACRTALDDRRPPGASTR